MTRKITAALTALVMCAGLSACGEKAAKEESKADTSSSAAVTSSEKEKAEETSTVTEEKPEDSKADESKPEETTESEAPASEAPDGAEEYTTEEGTSVKRTGNIIYSVTYSDIEEKPTDEDVKGFAEAAVRHIEASRGGDMQAFLDTMGLGLMQKPVNEVNTKINELSDEDFESWCKDANHVLQYELSDEVAGLWMVLGSEKAAAAVEDTIDATDPEKFSEAIAELVGSISPDEPNTADNLTDETIWDTEGEPIAVSDDAVILLLLEYYGKDGDDAYFWGDITIVDGDNSYRVPDYLMGWKIDGKYGVFAGIDVDEGEADEEMKGKTAEELFKIFAAQQ